MKLIAEWKLWYSSLRNSQKWFVLLLLFKPILDGLYFLKEISPFLSPLYIIGVGYPFLVLLSFVFDYQKLDQSVNRLTLFWGYSWILVLTSLLLFLQNGLDLISAQTVLKILLPVYTMAYARRYFIGAKMMRGIMITFLVSSIIPAVMIVYENVIGPIRVAESREVLRYSGIYADIFNYSLHLMFSIIIFGFMWFSGLRWGRLKMIFYIGMLTALVFVTLTSINHLASWGVFLAILTTYFVYSNQRRLALLIVVSALGIAFLNLGSDRIYSELQDKPLMSKEMEILRGERDVNQGFHGRVSRWTAMSAQWSNMDYLAKMLGAQHDYIAKNVLSLLLVVPHNDYLRILYASGLVGLILYLGFLLSSFNSAFRSAMPFRFLYVSVLLTLVLYSISATPTIYPGYVMVSFVFIANMNRIKVVSDVAESV